MSDDTSRNIRIDAAGSSADEAIERLPPLYDGTRWSARPTADAYSYRYAAVGDHAMTLRHSSMNGYIEGDIPPGEDYVIQWLVSGTSVVDLGRDPLPQKIGRPLLFPAHRTFVFSFTDYDQRLVQLNRETINDMAEERMGAQPDAVRFDHTKLPAQPATALWLDTVGLIARTTQRGDVNPLLWSELARMAGAAFFELYPPQGVALPKAVMGSEHARLRRAVEYIHENAQLPLTPSELAVVADLSVRALQNAFQKTLGMSPLGYARQVRLERVHAELQVAQRSDTTVSEVAHRWGFAHLGRFAAAYAQRFGVSPSQTLNS